MPTKMLLLLVCSAIVFEISEVAAMYLESPCPSIFRYSYDQNNRLYGNVRVVGTDSTKLQLNIEMSVGNTVRGYNGNIELGVSKEKVVDDIINLKPILYKLYFPAWTNIPPKITKILVNGNLICRGPKIPLGLVPILTTINLQHTLSIEGQPLRSSSTPIESNFIPPDYTNSNSGLQPPPPPDTDFDVRSRPPPPPPPDSESEYGNPRRAPPPPPPPDFENNQFGFKPAPTKHGLAPGNNFHFKPQMPKDPSKIYPTNPFFLSSTSRPTRTDFHPGNNPDNSKNFNIPKVDIPAEKDTEFISKDGVLENIPFRNVCGKPLSTNSLIINGDVVPRGAFPWLVAIFGVKVTGLNYMCSASLISDRHVVTAAHCVRTESKRYRPQDILIILGKMNIQKWVPIEGEKMIEPESIHVHPDYKSFTSDADIAMIVLSDRVQFTKYIRPLCLWTGSTELETIIGKQGTVVGWGKDENGVLMTAEPKQTKLPIVSQEQCLRSSYQFQYITSNRTFCAGFRNGSGPCNGDSGSGFIMQREGRWFLKGVVSMAVSDTQTRTCDLSNYVVFTDASKFLSWLLSFVK